MKRVEVTYNEKGSLNEERVGNNNINEESVLNTNSLKNTIIVILN